MNVVDSSAWLEYFGDLPNADLFSDPIGDTAALLVPTIVLFEVFKRALLDKGEDYAEETLGFMIRGVVIDLDANIALSAVRLSVEHRLALADSIILATARAYDAVLWTQDADFEGMPGVQYCKHSNLKD